MSNSKIGVVVVNYGGLNDTLECLKSVYSSNPIPKKVVVANVYDRNRGKVEEGKLVKRAYPEVEVIDADNKGFSAANNLGIKWLLNNKVETIMLLNNDTLIDKNLLKNMYQAVKINGVGGVSPKIYFYQGYEYHREDYQKEDRGKIIWYAGGLYDKRNFYAWHRGVDEVDHGQFDEQNETNFVTGCCLVAKREIWEKVGLLDEKAFLYYEDMDWSLRTIKAGYKLLYEPEGIVWHKNAGSTGGSGSDTHVYYQTRNRYYYGLKYAPLKTKLSLLKEAYIKFFQGSKSEKMAVKDFLINKYGKYET